MRVIIWRLNWETDARLQWLIIVWKVFSLKQDTLNNYKTFITFIYGKVSFDIVLITIWNLVSISELALKLIIYWVHQWHVVYRIITTR